MIAILPASDFVYLSRFASTEETRFYLQGVFVDSGHKGAVQGVATNGRILGSITFEPEQARSTAPCIIKTTKDLLRLAKTKPSIKGSTRYIEQTEDRVNVFDCIGLEDEHVLAASLPQKPIDGTFPDWRRVIPEPSEKTGALIDLGFNADYLALFGHGNPPFVSILPNGEGAAYVLNTDPRFFGLIMPARCRDKFSREAAIERANVERSYVQSESKAA